ncbi:subtilisin-like protease-like [Musa troglodytarum]|uniref:Subtilisin-like protease-like n=1 Tax=Musa troglodytarum TaxID=320322 RepID=A0A9E7KR74_9LILI|nr:subtilisin-like protease-like [Musa troglodytarum]
MAPSLSLMVVLFLMAQAHPSAYASMERRTYIVHMDATKIAALDDSLGGANRWPQAVLDSLSSSRGEGEAQPAPQLLYVYDTALSGFAATLSAKQAESLQQLDGVLTAYPDELIHLHTTHSPDFLGLNPGKGLWSSPNLASDIVVGVIDTGIWPEHVSFSDTGYSSVNLSRWRGACEAGRGFSASNCNRKLVGALAFWKGYEAGGGKINETSEYRSARDSQGHGTHTASTAAGNIVAGASLLGNAKGSAKGMRTGSTFCLSLGGGSREYYSDSVAIAAFGAVRKGVFISCSAGNSGPYESTVSNTAPWIMTVAASYLDRRFPTSVKLGDGRTFEGASLYAGKPTELVPIAYGDTAGGRGARFCIAGSLSSKRVMGKMVLCDRGLISRTEKGEQVKLAGGVAMLLLNSEEQGEELFADLHVLPASSVGAAATTAIKSYIASSKTPTAMITFQGTVYGKTAPMMAAFSSRGPSLVGPDIIKPDVTAPGMAILAAWPPSVSPSLVDSDQRRVNFNIISGTSMSCPHVSGLAALLKSLHLDWSPAAIRSALMTTAFAVDSKNASIIDVSTGLPATPFVLGSGHVDPEKASKPGLIYDIAPDDYLNYLCSLKYTPQQLATFSRKKYNCPKNKIIRARDLNYPSFAVLFDGGRKKSTLTHTRTVTNVGQAQCRYTVNVREPQGVRITGEADGVDLQQGRAEAEVHGDVF